MMKMYDINIQIKSLTLIYNSSTELKGVALTLKLRVYYFA